jgi:hypothetical protein
MNKLRGQGAKFLHKFMGSNPLLSRGAEGGGGAEKEGGGKRGENRGEMRSKCRHHFGCYFGSASFGRQAFNQ